MLDDVDVSLANFIGYFKGLLIMLPILLWSMDGWFDVSLATSCEVLLNYGSCYLLILVDDLQQYGLFDGVDIFYGEIPVLMDYGNVFVFR